MGEKQQNDASALNSHEKPGCYASEVGSSKLSRPAHNNRRPHRQRNMFRRHAAKSAALSQPSADAKWCLSVGRRLGSRSTAPKPSPPTSYAKHARNVTKLYTLTNRLRQAGRGHNQFVYSHQLATLTNRPASPDCGLSPTGFVNANHRYPQRSNHRNRLRQPTTNDRQLTPTTTVTDCQPPTTSYQQPTINQPE